MKYILAVILMINLASLQAQCDWKTSEYDPFLKATKNESANFTLKSGLVQAFGIQIRNFDSTYILIVQEYGSGLVSRVIGPDDKISFLLEDQNVVTVFPLEIITSDLNPSSVSDSYSVKIPCSVSLDQLNLLGNSLIKSYRIYYTGGYVENEVKKKHALKILNFLSCLGGE